MISACERVTLKRSVISIIAPDVKVTMIPALSEFGFSPEITTGGFIV